MLLLVGVHFDWGHPRPSGPQDIVHPVHPLATPLFPSIDRPLEDQFALCRTLSEPNENRKLRNVLLKRPMAINIS